MIWIIGADGQLGQELSRMRPDAYTSKVKDCDISSMESIYSFLENLKAKGGPEISVIINCAAYTAVDKAEEEHILAFKINSDSVTNLISIAKELDAHLIHISTDYVFSGNQSFPYSEEDTPFPLSVYGKSKLEGEEIIRNSEIKSTILRTSWLYSEFGNNFVKSILNKVRTDPDQKLRIVFDQVGTPTYAGDLADAIFNIIEKRESNPQNFENCELLHFTNEGVSSWYDFTIAILEYSNLKCHVEPILTSEYPTKAKRPPYSVLDKSKIKKLYQQKIPHWREGLKKCLLQIKT